MCVSCETACYQEKRLSVLVNNPFPESARFRVLLIEVSGGFPGYSAPATQSIDSTQCNYNCSLLYPVYTIKQTSSKHRAGSSS